MAGEYKEGRENQMENIEKLRDIRLFLFDMDGTLYIGDRLFDFTVPLLDKIKKSGGRYMFFTNNSSKSVSAYIEKLKKTGYRSRQRGFSHIFAGYGLLSEGKSQPQHVLRMRNALP